MGIVGEEEDEEEEEEAIVVEELGLVGFEGVARLDVREERRYSGEDVMLLSREREGRCIERVGEGEQLCGVG